MIIDLLDFIFSNIWFILIAYWFLAPLFRRRKEQPNRPRAPKPRADGNWPVGEPAEKGGTRPTVRPAEMGDARPPGQPAEQRETETTAGSWPRPPFEAPAFPWEREEPPRPLEIPGRRTAQMERGEGHRGSRMEPEMPAYQESPRQTVRQYESETRETTLPERNWDDQPYTAAANQKIDDGIGSADGSNNTSADQDDLNLTHISRQEVVKGMIWSQVFGPPRASSPHPGSRYSIRRR